MGLDNGIIVKNISLKNVPKNLVQLPLIIEDSDEIEIVYFRKCWGIRDAILDTIHGFAQDRSPVDIEDIPAIIRALEKFCSKEYWDENANSIWTFEEVLDFTLI